MATVRIFLMRVSSNADIVYDVIVHYLACFSVSASLNVLVLVLVLGWPQGGTPEAPFALLLRGERYRCDLNR